MPRSGSGRRATATTVVRPARSSSSARPSSTAGRRRSSPPGSTTRSTSTSRTWRRSSIVTGGKAEGDRTTEAAAARAYAVARGVPAAAIAMEDAGRTTLRVAPGRRAGCSAAGASGTPCSSATRPTCCGSCGWPPTWASSRTARRRATSRVESDPVQKVDATVHELGALAYYLFFKGSTAEDSAPAVPDDGGRRRRSRRGSTAQDRCRRASGPIWTRKLVRIPGHPPWRAGIERLYSAKSFTRAGRPARQRPARRSRPCAPQPDRPPSVNRTEPPRATTTRRGTT